MKEVSSANTLLIYLTQASHSDIFASRSTSVSDTPQSIRLQCVRRWHPMKDGKELPVQGDAAFNIDVVVLEEGNAGAAPGRFMISGIVSEIEGPSRVILVDSNGKVKEDEIGITVNTHITAFIDTTAHAGCIVSYYNGDRKVIVPAPEEFTKVICDPGIPFQCRPTVNEDYVLQQGNISATLDSCRYYDIYNRALEQNNNIAANTTSPNAAPQAGTTVFLDNEEDDDDDDEEDGELD